jgi:hypothetical protein
VPDIRLSSVPLQLSRWKLRASTRTRGGYGLRKKQKLFQYNLRCNPERSTATSPKTQKLIDAREQHREHPPEIDAFIRQEKAA